MEDTVHQMSSPSEQISRSWNRLVPPIIRYLLVENTAVFRVTSPRADGSGCSSRALLPNEPAQTSERIILALRHIM
jgi:hypothetical protein